MTDLTWLDAVGTRGAKATVATAAPTRSPATTWERAFLDLARQLTPRQRRLIVALMRGFIRNH